MTDNISGNDIADENLPHIIQGGEGWLVVEKPAGMSIHNDPGFDLVSIVKKIVSDDKKLASKIDYTPGAEFSPAHRLDRDTSGLVMVACRKELLNYFGKQFEKGSVEKRYTAIVHGRFDPEFKEKLNSWEFPLAKKHGGRMNPAGSGKKTFCKTDFRIIDESGHYSLLDIDLQTGRKHQIRRHAKIAKHPLLSDKRYGSEKAVAFLKTHKNFTRLALHSYALTIRIPDASLVTFTAKQIIPNSFKTLFESDKHVDY